MRRSLFLLFLSLLLAGAAHAAQKTVRVTGTVTYVEGSYTGDFSVGQAFGGTYVYDTDEAQADPGAITTPSTVPGHEFSSFYEFTGPPYRGRLSFPAIPGTFAVDRVAVVVNDDLALTSDETNGAVPDGTYDWIELLASNTIGICLEPGGVCDPDEFSPADGEEWTVALIGDTSWISDGSLVPDDLPASPTALLVGLEFDAAGNETGVVFGTVTASAPAVPALGPAAAAALTALLLGSARGWLRRRA
ncbi:MAG: hypothetical protein ACQGVC_11260 [Myxococcota bacterium]